MPEEGYYFVTHTPEQAKKWQDICTSDPERVVQVIQLIHASPATTQGDDTSDIFPALEALQKISKGKVFGGPPDPAWGPLVEQGLAEALCEAVLNMTTNFHPLPSMPKPMREKAANDVTSSYFPSLMILCNASMRFSQPPGPHDKRTIAALKSRWSDMMERLWEEPQNTLRPEGSHVLERMVVAQLLVRIIITDPTFLNIVYSDKTIPVITRHWAHSTDDDFMDSRVTASMIHLLFNPAHPAHVKYVEKHPQPTSEIFSGVLLGGGPLPSSEKPAQVSALLEVFANHLGRFNRHDAYLELDFLSDLLQLADEDIMRGVLKCDVLWKNMIGLMKRSHAPDTPDPKQDTPGIAVIPYCISIISQTINIASGRDREYLVRVCLEAGFFNVLDEVVASIEIMERRGDVCRPLARLFMALQMVMQTADEPLKDLIRQQFPRPRTLGSLAQNDLRFQIFDPKNPTVPRAKPVPPSTFVQFCWQLCAALQFGCVDESVCSKRGCGKRGTARCGSCKTALYCGPECQKSDWKDHKVLCVVSEFVKKAGENLDKIGGVLTGHDRVPF